jgi:hypothetical protein
MMVGYIWTRQHYIQEDVTRQILICAMNLNISTKCSV